MVSPRRACSNAAQLSDASKTWMHVLYFPDSGHNLCASCTWTLYEPGVSSCMTRNSQPFHRFSGGSDWCQILISTNQERGSSKAGSTEQEGMQRRQLCSNTYAQILLGATPMRCHCATHNGLDRRATEPARCWHQVASSPETQTWEIQKKSRLLHHELARGVHRGEARAALTAHVHADLHELGHVALAIALHRPALALHQLPDLLHSCAPRVPLRCQQQVRQLVDVILQHPNHPG